MKLKYIELNHPFFMSTLEQLFTRTGFGHIDTALAFGHVFKQIKTAVKMAQKEFLQMALPFVELNLDGNPKPVSEGKGHPLCPWELKPDSIEGYTKALQEFLNKEVVIEGKPLSKESLKNSNLSMKQLEAIKSLLDFSIDVTTSETSADQLQA